MRCKSCDYPLWTIRARQCPECGAGFVPSEYDFAANAVEYRCPHCDQRYYGTDERGHLVPREFECVSCGRRVHMDEMVLFPAEGVEEDRATLPILPWLDRRRKWTRAWRTVGMGMVRPRRLMDATPVESSVGRAWWFYTLVMLLVSVLSGAAVFAVLLGMGGVLTGVAGLAVFLVALFGWPALWGLVAHGLMKVFGARPRHTLGRTYQAICYTSGAMMPSAIPCLGANLLPVTMVWWIVSAAIAVAHGQGARGGRAAVAVVLLPALVWLGGTGLVVGGIVMGFRAAARAGAAMGAMRASSVHTALVGYASVNGSAPAHGVELLADGSISWWDLHDPGSITRPPTGTVGGVALPSWPALPAEEQEAAVEEALAGLEEGWVAHRLGDVVFTYNGVDLLMPRDPGLWVFVYWPDPASGAAWIQGEPVRAVRVDGTVEEIDLSDFRTRLEEQNALREGVGLGALPHPEEVVGGERSEEAGGER